MIVSTIDFFTRKITIKTAANMVLSVARKDDGRTEVVITSCIVGAMVSTHLLGKPTQWMKAHELWHMLNEDQVTLMPRTVSHSMHDTIQ